MWFGLATNLKKITSADQDILVGSDIISRSAVVGDLGVFFDSELNMNMKSRDCFYHLQRLYAVRRLHAWAGAYSSSSFGIRSVET